MSKDSSVVKARWGDAVSLSDRLSAVSTADAADLLRTFGIKRTVMRGLRAQWPVGKTHVGRARTLRMLPEREDIQRPVNGPANRGLYDGLERGDVLVVDAMGLETHAVLGDMMLTRILARGAAAVVVDGAVRDLATMANKGMPIFARGTSPEVFMGRMRPWESDGVIQCGGVLVEPRDFILADGDGVLVVPSALAGRLAEGAEAKRDSDAFSHALLSNGFGLDDAYPLPGHMKQFLPLYVKDGTIPTVDEVRRK